MHKWLECQFLYAGGHPFAVRDNENGTALSSTPRGALTRRVSVAAHASSVVGPGASRRESAILTSSNATGNSTRRCLSKGAPAVELSHHQDGPTSVGQAASKRRASVAISSQQQDRNNFGKLATKRRSLADVPPQASKRKSRISGDIALQPSRAAGGAGQGASTRGSSSDSLSFSNADTGAAQHYKARGRNTRGSSLLRGKLEKRFSTLPALPADTSSSESSSEDTNTDGFMESVEEDLPGVSVQKPFEPRLSSADGRRASPRESEEAKPVLTKTAMILSKLEMFNGFGFPALLRVDSTVAHQHYRKGDVMCREGDRQHWMGILASGSASLSINTDPVTDGDRFATLNVGDAFGELAVLQIREIRTATVIAEAECHVLVLHANQLWAQCRLFDYELQLIHAEIERWKAFLACRMFVNCHVELACQLRHSATKRVLLKGEELHVGGTYETRAATSTREGMDETSAIVEVGSLKLVGHDSHETFGTSAVVNERGVLGVSGDITVTPCSAQCSLVILRRDTFWNLMSKFIHEKEHFVRLATSLLPPSTTDLSSCEILSFLQGSANFWRLLQGLARQRIHYPGETICGAEETSDVLRFFQQGSAEYIVHGKRIALECVGGCCGELNLLGTSAVCAATVRALDLCVLQEITRRDLEQLFGRHPTVRNRFRELAKLKPHFMRDSSMGVQLQRIKDISFFSDMSEDFLSDFIPNLQDHIYLANQVVASEGMKRIQGNFLTIILDGTCLKTIEGESAQVLGPGSISGEIGLFCNIGESDKHRRETVIAQSVCCIQKLHRALLMDSLQKFSMEKRHFEVIARDYMASGVSGSVRKASDSQTSIYSLPLFKNCDSRFLYLLDLHLERHLFFGDEVIVKEQTEGEDLYIMYSGTASVQVQGSKVGTLSEGMCFGEMAVLGHVKLRLATIIANTLCDVRTLSRRSLEEAIQEFPDELDFFETLAATRHRITQESQSGGKVSQMARFFQDCEHGFIVAMTECAVDKLYTAGRYIIKQGDVGDWMVLIRQGSCDILVNGQHVGVLKGGDVAGEIALFHMSGFRTASVVATSVCFVQILYRSDVLPVLERFPQERQRFRERASQRVLNSTQIRASIRNVEIWKSSPRAFVDFLDRKAKRMIFFNGDVLATENSPGVYLFAIMAGVVQVVRFGDVVGEVGSGAIVGELAVMAYTERRTATLRCRDICDVYIVRRADVKAALKTWPEQEATLRRLAARNLRKDIQRANQQHFLGNCSLFAQCSAKFIDCISEHLEDRLILRGEQLCKQGDRGDTMFVLMQGSLNCEIDGRSVQTFLAGSVIGEIVVLGLANVRTATLTANDVCFVQVLHRSVFMKHLSEYPRDMIQFQEAGAARLALVPVPDKAQVFDKQPLFKRSSHEFVKALREKLRRTFYFAGQKIVKEGSDSVEMYAILQGRAVLERRNTTVGDIDSGQSFGEMAVMGIVTAQTLTVKAHTLCDMHVLSRWDLEELLKEFPEERQRLLDVVAGMMREDLSELSDVQVLGQLGFFQNFQTEAIEAIAKVAKAKVSRKGEIVSEATAIGLTVFLQGSAVVEVHGVPTRDLSEGDTFGACTLVNASELMNCAVRATSSCLTLVIGGDAFAEVIQQFPDSESHIQSLASKFKNGTADLGQAALGNAVVMKQLKLGSEQLEGLLQHCEEIVYASREEVLSTQSRHLSLLLVLCGRVRIEEPGKLPVTLEHGCSVGELSEKPRAERSSTSFYAMTACKVLVLHKRAFLSWVELCSADECSRILANFDALRHEERNTNLLRFSLREQADRRASELVRQVVAGIKLQQKHQRNRRKPPAVGAGWRKAQASWRQKLVRFDAKSGQGDQTDQSSGCMPAGEGASVETSTAPDNLPPSKPQARVVEMPPEVPRAQKAASPRRRKIQGAGYDEAVQHQTQLLREELVRLTNAARMTAAAARKDEAKFRKQVEGLRIQYAELERHEGDDRLRSVDDNETAHTRKLHAGIAAAEKRIEDLHGQLEQARALQKELLSQLRCNASRGV